MTMTNLTTGLDGAMTFLNVSRATMLNLAESGEVRGAKIAIGWVFKYSDLDDYLTKQIDEQTTARLEARLSGNMRPKVGTAASKVARIGRGKRRELPNLESLEAA